MATLICRVLGHRRTRAVFSSRRVFCARCGLDLEI